MAIQTRAYLLTRFQNGDKPTEDDFEDLIDSYLHLSDDPLKLAGKVISSTFPGSTSGTQAIPAGSVLHAIIIRAAEMGTVNIGTTGGGVEIADAEPYINGSIEILRIKDFPAAATLYFTGHTDSITVKTILIYV